jgi:uroporphyrinogen-III synthase
VLTLLLTRPLPQSEAFAAALAARLPGRFRPVIAPLTAIVPRPDAAVELADAAALAFTSANAVAAYADRSPRRDLPAYCVGASTAAAARAAGFAARTAEGDAAALAALIARDRPGPVLHPRGAEAAADLAALLAALGVPARSVVLYDQVTAEPPAAADAALGAGAIDAVALFSPNAARRFAAAATARGWPLGRTATVAISAAADAPLAPLEAACGLDPGRRHRAAAPSRAAMIEALGRL